jgi:DnaJ-class molecular chaperone
MGKPYICPICCGKGTVPQSFYEQPGFGTATSIGEVSCKTCHGEGIVWSPYEAKF